VPKYTSFKVNEDAKKDIDKKVSFNSEAKGKSLNKATVKNEQIDTRKPSLKKDVKGKDKRIKDEEDSYEEI